MGRFLSRYMAKAKAGFADLINAFVEGQYPISTGSPISAAASTMAKAGAAKRAETFAAKQARVHAELLASVRARVSQ